MAWTTEKIKQLKKLWNKGKSTVEIGKELGISKNAVVGKVHRLELEARPSPIKKPVKTTRPKKTEPESKTHIGLLDLKMNSCRWPIGDPKDADFHFCGATTSTGKPYCPEHCKIAYTSLKELTLQNAKAKKEKAAQQVQAAEDEKPIKKAEEVTTKETKATKGAKTEKVEKPAKAEKAPTKTTKTKEPAKPAKAVKATKVVKETPAKATKTSSKTPAKTTAKTTPKKAGKKK